MEDEGKIKVERFNNANLGFQKMQSEDYLYQKDLYLPLNGNAQKLKEISNDEWDILDQKP